MAGTAGIGDPDLAERYLRQDRQTASVAVLDDRLLIEEVLVGLPDHEHVRWRAVTIE